MQLRKQISASQILSTYSNEDGTLHSLGSSISTEILAFGADFPSSKQTLPSLFEKLMQIATFSFHKHFINTSCEHIHKKFVSRTSGLFLQLLMFAEALQR